MKKLFKVLLILVVIVAGAGLFLWFGVINQKINVGGDEVKVYIRKGDGYEELLKDLEDSKLVEDMFWFRKMAEFKKLPSHIHEGRYTIKAGMTYNQLINYFRSAQIDIVNVDFHSIRTKSELADRVSSQIEASKDSILELLNSDRYMSKYGLNSENALVLFLPNKYQMYWNTSADQFISKMAKEFKKFWTDARKAKAKKLNLSQSEVVILASIVQAEQSKVTSEWPVIAGLYLNRLKTGMPLQSDPTVVYAHGNFSMNRVYRTHLEINSPYNTYRNRGLPPGPIYLARQDAIDAVLNAADHDYFYMCASGDGSYRHNFACSYSEHLRNAKMYTDKLNQQGIK
ncbi:MAG: endolytic transglycosylase MltG [Flavobacteriales bacterium]